MPPVDSPDFHPWLEALRLRVCIDDLLSLASPALGDEFAVFDVSADATRKVTFTALQSLIVTGGITLGTVTATTSGTTKDITGIASGTKRIIILFNGSSHNGTSNWLVRIGDSGGIDATGYLSVVAGIGAAGAVIGNVTSTTGFLITSQIAAGNTIRGVVMLCLEDSANFTWVQSGLIGSSEPAIHMSAGRNTLASELTQIRITSVTPNTMDAGEFNTTTE